MGCHRCVVADLVLEQAAARGEAVEVIEWPGGAAQPFALEPTPEVRTALRRKATHLPFTAEAAVALHGPPWGSVASVALDDGVVRLLVGPAALHGGAWRLPICAAFADPHTPEETVRAQAEQFRRRHGLEARGVGM